MLAADTVATLHTDLLPCYDKLHYRDELTNVLAFFSKEISLALDN